MKFEISNPSDKAFIESDDFEMACLATCILGAGYYGLNEVGGEKSMPIFLLGGSEIFFKREFNKSFSESLTGADKNKLASVLETVSLAGERTSLNDIVKSAQSLAKSLKKQ